MTKQLKNHILKFLSQDIRTDGRGLTDYRQPVEIKTGIIETAEGSAYVKVGDTEVLVGVKMEMGKPFPDTPDKGVLMVGAEFLQMSSPDFESGPPSKEAIELSRLVDRAIRESNCIDLKKLCVEPGEKVWMLIVDICPLNHAGNLWDIASLGAILALKNAVFPEVKDGKVDYKHKTKNKLPISNIPLSITVFKIGDKLIIDPTIEEGKVYDARLTVGSLDDGTLCSLQKGGDVTLSLEEIDTMVKLAIEKAAELRKYVKGE